MCWDGDTGQTGEISFQCNASKNRIILTYILTCFHFIWRHCHWSTVTKQLCLESDTPVPFIYNYAGYPKKKGALTLSCSTSGAGTRIQSTSMPLISIVWVSFRYVHSPNKKGLMFIFTNLEHFQKFPYF